MTDEVDQRHEGARTQGEDAAPGQEPGTSAQDLRGAVAKYAAGFVISILLTLASFWAAGTDAVYGPSVPVLLAALAVGQMGVHLVFFLHVSSGPESTNNILALAFGVFVVGLVVFGSIVIMDSLDANMMQGDVPRSTSMRMPVEPAAGEVRHVVNRSGHAFSATSSSMQHGGSATPLRGESQLWAAFADDHFWPSADLRRAGARGQVNRTMQVMTASDTAMNLQRFLETATTRCPQALLQPEEDFELSISLDPTLGIVRSDTTLLRQGAVQLLSDAIRFSHSGGHVAIRSAFDGPDTFRIDFEDHGVGIAESDMPRFFIAVQQVSEGSTEQFPDAGLGLALMKRLV